MSEQGEIFDQLEELARLKVEKLSLQKQLADTLALVVKKGAKIADLEVDKKRLEDLKEWLEDIVACGGACSTDWGDGYEVACKDALKELEEQDHE